MSECATRQQDGPTHAISEDGQPEVSVRAFTTPRTLPQELVDMVTENFRDDMNMLKSCSLVCNIWNTSSSRHLFETFAYAICHKCRRRRWHTQDETRPESTLEILSRSSRICNSVREFKVDQYSFICPFKDAELGLTFPLLFSLLDLLPSLRHLTLHGRIFAPASPLIAAHYHYPRTLDTLRIAPALNVSVQALLDLLPTLHAVGTLTVAWPASSRITGFVPRTPANPQRRLAIDTLEIRTDDDEAHAAQFLALLRTVLDFPAIRSVAIAGVPAFAPAVLQALRTMPALSALTYEPSEAHIPARDGLPPLRALTVRARVTFCGCATPPCASWDVATRDLRLLAGAQTRAVHVAMELSPHDNHNCLCEREEEYYECLEEYMKTLDWGALGGALQGCGGLETVRFEVRCITDSGPYEVDVPRCAGIVRRLIEPRMPASLRRILDIAVAPPGSFFED